MRARAAGARSPPSRSRARARAERRTQNAAVSSSWSRPYSGHVGADHVRVGVGVEVVLAAQRGPELVVADRSRPDHLPRAVAPRSTAGRRPSTASPAARRRRSPGRADRRSSSGTSSSRRGSGPPARLALDCSTGQRTPASSGTTGTRNPSVDGSSPHASGKRPAGLGSSTLTAPGSSRSKASRVRSPSSGNADERKRDVEEHHRRRLPKRPALQACTGAGRRPCCRDRRPGRRRCRPGTPRPRRPTCIGRKPPRSSPAPDDHPLVPGEVAQPLAPTQSRRPASATTTASA